MTTWAYRCGEVVSRERTEFVLDTHRFCWRSVYTQVAMPATVAPPLIANVKRVDVGDSLRIYYPSQNGFEFLGAFRIRKPDVPLPDPSVAPAIGLAGKELEDLLFESGYDPDPFLMQYTGLFLKPDTHAPVLAPPKRNGQNALRRIG